MAGKRTNSEAFSMRRSTGAAVLALVALMACQADAPTSTLPLDGASLAKGGGGGPGGGGGGSAPTVTSANPPSAVQDTTIDVDVFGTGFTSGAKAKWSLSGDTTQVIVKSTKVVNSTKLTARIQVPATALVGSYDVIVTLSNGKTGVGAEMFAVQSRPLYKFRFISGVSPSGDGEISSDWFPDVGIRIAVNNPWVQVDLGGTTIGLNNFTHGDFSVGKCAEFLANYQLPVNLVNWDIAGTSPTRSYAGTWNGTVIIKDGYLAFDGDRVVNGVLTPGAGGIHNVVTQQNVTIKTQDPNNDWFRQEVRNAAFKFGGASTPDGADMPNSELACINYTIELRKTTLIP